MQWVSSRTKMDELHVDLCMQNQDFRPEIKITQIKYKKKKKGVEKQAQWDYKMDNQNRNAPQEVFLPETWTNGYLHP